MTQVTRLNLRVYGVLENEAGDILLVHEKIGDFHFTKFPGGGLEFGEGTRDCLIREFKEESGLDVEVTSHLYTTDFFQVSAFRPSDQLISVYYKVRARIQPPEVNLEEFDIDNNGRIEQMRFFWVKREAFHEDLVTFPIDKIVCTMIRNREV